jgi:hypothetical protein
LLVRLALLDKAGFFIQDRLAIELIEHLKPLWASSILLSQPQHGDGMLAQPRITVRYAPVSAALFFG